MDKKGISRKQALKQLGGLAIGTGLAPWASLSNTKKGAMATDEVKPLNTKATKPHIIMIMTDQQRGDAVGCDGNPSVKTPHIDAIAKDGVFFNHAYSEVPSCTPARACLLSGQTPWNNGMLGYGKTARKYKYELPRMVREGGYYAFCMVRTTGFRKNHFGDFMVQW